jgi:hypothetical protein
MFLGRVVSMRLVMRTWVAAMPAALASLAAQPTPAHAAYPYAGWTQPTKSRTRS